MVIIKRILILILLIGSISLKAQENEDFSDLDLIEAEIDSVTKENQNLDTEVKDVLEIKKIPQKIDSINDLSYLEDWKQLAIIHPRYQPKFKRFQFFGGLGSSLNNPWYLEGKVDLRASYHFTDLIGMEISYFSFSGVNTAIARELDTRLNIQSSSLIQSNAYLGAHLYFAPIYGKMSLFNQKIVSYDVYFTLGLGQSSLINSVTNLVPTLHIGAGQLFALSRNAALRWGISVQFFEAQSNLQVQKTQLQSILMSLGFSYFLPEMSQR